MRSRSLFQRRMASGGISESALFLKAHQEVNQPCARCGGKYTWVIFIAKPRENNNAARLKYTRTALTIAPGRVVQNPDEDKTLDAPNGFVPLKE